MEYVSAFYSSGSQVAARGTLVGGYVARRIELCRTFQIIRDMVRGDTNR